MAKQTLLLSYCLVILHFGRLTNFMFDVVLFLYNSDGKMISSHFSHDIASVEALS